MTKNVSFTVQNKLCTGCGICEDVCPRQCIEIVCLDKEYRPVVNEKSCLGDKCGRCLKVCPGIGLDIKKSGNLFRDKDIKEDKFIGRYVSLHTGYSKDMYIRYHSASGGMVSQFLIYLLDRKIIDGALVTRFADDHITPYSYIARTKDEVIAARSSKYCPVSLNKIGNEIANSQGRYVIVGLPCHIQGFRKRASIDKKFQEKVVGYFSLYCSSNRTFGARDYLLKKYKLKKSDILYFAFRDDGCLGNLKIQAKVNVASATKSRLVGTDSTDKTGLEIPFSQYYGRQLRSFFKPHRCLTCIDHYGELADVCFGDIHIQPYLEDKIGISSWIVRSDYWEKLFIEAKKDGYIEMWHVEREILNNSQATMLYPKRRKASAVMSMDRILGREIPKYDIQMENPHWYDYISEIGCHLQRFVGRHTYLWFLIDVLNKIRK